MQMLDDISFNDLIERFRLPLTRAAYHLCGNRDASLDIVQETLLDAYKGYKSLREPEKTGAWLYAILRRKAITYYKTQRVEARTINELIQSGSQQSKAPEAYSIYIE